MSFASKHNKTARSFDLNTEGFPFMSMKQLYNDPVFGPDTIYPVDGVYVFTTKYGEKPALVSMANRFFISMPGHQCEEVKKILADPEDIQAIKSGAVGAKIVEWDKDKHYFKIEWVDIELPY